MPDPALWVPDLPAGVALVPGAVELLGCSPELHDEVAGEVLWLGLSSLLAPQADQGGFIAAHNDAGVGAADEGATVRPVDAGELMHKLLHRNFTVAYIIYLAAQEVNSILWNCRNHWAAPLCVGMI